MQKNPHPSKDHRLLFIIIFCAVSGAILNSSAAWAESTTCWQAENPSLQCLNKPPVISAIEGGMMGIMAGTGAALGAVWKRFF
ncbi:MAG: hypothetical protein NW220_03530 [Leptolyngbyaceae cyanobacterium bins.349]|nr:hypothetical protein [Leptolyngbyaceae cyanobacterium bins.349]